MKIPLVFERITEPGFPAGYFYCHMPTMGLTTHGPGIDGAREAAVDLAHLWIAEKEANGETISEPGDVLLSTAEVA